MPSSHRTPHAHRNPHPWVAATVLLTVTLAGVGLAAEAPRWQMPAFLEPKDNPVPPTAASIKRGRRIFLNNCATCHGKKGRGNGPAAAALQTKPRDLTAPRLWKQPDGELFWKIRTGRTPMPGWEKSFDKKQIWDLVNYIRSLGGLSINAPEHASSSAQRRSLAAVLREYAPVRRALARGHQKRARSSTQKLLKATRQAAGLKPAKLSEDGKKRWNRITSDLLEASRTLKSAEEPSGFRKGFARFSEGLKRLVSTFGSPTPQPALVFRCPLALEGRGAFWLQRRAPVRSPYAPDPKPTCRVPRKAYPRQPVSETAHNTPKDRGERTTKTASRAP